MTKVRTSAISCDCFVEPSATRNDIALPTPIHCAIRVVLNQFKLIFSILEKESRSFSR